MVQRSMLTDDVPDDDKRDSLDGCHPFLVHYDFYYGRKEHCTLYPSCHMRGDQKVLQLHTLVNKMAKFNG